MSKRHAELVTESATAKQMPVRNLSEYVKVEKDNKADYVVSVQHPTQTIKAGSNQRHESKLASSAVSMEEQTLVNIAGSN